KLYYIRYPVEGGPAPYVTVATTRPETLLGDTAVAVNPTDKRHRAFVGKVARLPIIDLPVPIIADDAVEPGFGTGFVKVTPAHDATDFEIGLRHKLEMPLVMTEDGRMEHPTRVPKTLTELDRFDAREKIVDMLKERGLLAKVEPHRHAVRHCYRCDSVVEPRLSDQWFVKMQPLAQPALEAYRAGAIRLVPERWGATYEHWMENIRDWNISRQLWWGHRIPVFTCTQCAPRRQWADREDPKACPKCGGPVEQDPDVLDTWFSSWLWPFATFGWPDRTPDLARFYPGHTLVTAPEILFFWVARMLMSGYHFMDRRLPFTTVYLHGTVRDTQLREQAVEYRAVHPGAAPGADPPARRAGRFTPAPGRPLDPDACERRRPSRDVVPAAVQTRRSRQAVLRVRVERSRRLVRGSGEATHRGGGGRSGRRPAGLGGRRGPHRRACGARVLL